MTRSIVVISSGLSETSSTRRLADQLGEATATALRARGVAVDVRLLH